MPLHSSPSNSRRFSSTSEPLIHSSKPSPFFSSTHRCTPSQGFTSTTSLRSSTLHSSLNPCLPPTSSSTSSSNFISNAPYVPTTIPPTTLTTKRRSDSTCVHDPYFLHLRNHVYAYNQCMKLASQSESMSLLVHPSSSSFSSSSPSSPSCSSSSTPELHRTQIENTEHQSQSTKKVGHLKQRKSKTQAGYPFFHAGV